MTEKLTVEDGRLKVERVDGKDSLDLDLSDVDVAYFERSPDPAKPGALILLTGDKADVVRVDNDEAGSVMEQVWPTIENARQKRLAPAPGNDEPAPGNDEPTDTSAPGNKRNARRSQTA